MNIAIITSFPLDVRIGSGVVTSLQGLRSGVEKHGHLCKIISPDFEQKGQLAIANLRLQFNRHLKCFDFSEFDFVIGSDFDGYAVDWTDKPMFAVLNGGLLADIVRFERGRSAKILAHLSQRERQNLHKANKIFVPSEYAKRRVSKLHNIEDSRIHVLPLGIDFGAWTTVLKKTDKLEKTIKTILCVAKQYPRKGIADLIKAFEILIKKGLPAQLQLIGSGSDESKNKQLAVELGIGEKVLFCGDVTDRSQLAAYLRNADIFCLPSYHETFGLVFLEAMAAGLPIVAYASTAVPEVISKKTGILVSTGDYRQLAVQMRHLIENPLIARKIGNQGIEYASQQTWEKTARKLLSFLN